MPLSPEELESLLLDLEEQITKLRRGGRKDPRLPLLATEFDLETAVFPPAVRAWRGSNQTINHNSVTAVNCGNEDFDTDGMHLLSGNTERLTAVTAGKYQITGTVTWDTDGTGARSLSIRANGTTLIGDVALPASTETLRMTVTTLYHLNAGEYVELMAWQNSGGARTLINEDNRAPIFMMHWAAP